MTRIAFALVAGLALAPAAAVAQSAPQIPTPVNPYPANPVSTDGTSLSPVYSGRSVSTDGGIDVFGVIVGRGTHR